MNDDQTSYLKIVPAHLDSPLDLDVQSFFLDCQARNLSANTLHNYTPALATFVRFLRQQGITTIQAITADHLRVFFTDLQQNHNAGGVYWHYRVIKTFMRFMKAEGDIAANPLERIRSPKMPQGILEPVALDVIGKLLDVCDGTTKERDRAILLCLLDSGLRASEFVALNTGDVDIGTGKVVVRHGKGNKTRVVFLGTKARRALLRYLKQKSTHGPIDPLWVGRYGERLRYSGLRQILRRKAAAAGVPCPSPHGFRRSFALFSLRSGMNVYALQKLMGHSDLTVLRRYLSQTEGDLQAAHAQASPVDRML